MAEVLGDTADGGRVAAPVVVEDDHHLGLELTDVVERLVCHAAGERAVADDAHDLARVAAQLTRRGETERVAETRRGVRVLDEVVLGLTARRIAAQATLLAERVEQAEPAGQHLVDVGLVPGVEDDRVARAVEDPVHRDRELDDAEVGPEVSTGPRDGGDQLVADLGAEAGQIFRAEPTQVVGAGDLLEQHRLSLVEQARLGSCRNGPHAWSRSMITGHAGTGATRGGARMRRAGWRYRRGRALARGRRLPRSRAGALARAPRRAGERAALALRP